MNMQKHVIDFLVEMQLPNQHMNMLKHVNLNLRKKVCQVLVVFLSNTAEGDISREDEVVLGVRCIG